MAAAPRTGAVLVHKAAVSLVAKLSTLPHFDAEGGDLDAECSIWTKAPVGRPAAIKSGRVGGGWGVGVGGWGSSLFTTPSM